MAISQFGKLRSKLIELESKILCALSLFLVLFLELGERSVCFVELPLTDLKSVRVVLCLSLALFKLSS